MTGPSDAHAFMLAGALVDPNRNSIACGDRERTIEPRIMDVLCRLAAEAGVVVSRADLIHSIWQVEHGGDESLTRAISILRKTFKEVGENAVVIETIPRRGYCLAQSPEPPSEGQHFHPNDNGDALTPIKTAHLTRLMPPRVGVRGITVSALVLLASVTAIMIGVGMLSESATKSEAPSQSVAVLPFVAISGTEKDNVFADGLTEELLARLASVEEWSVPGRTASFAYKNAAEEISDIGAALGVAYVLEGSVRRDGERLRIAAQLVSVQDGYRLWSEIYDRKDEDIFVIQNDIAVRVARALNAQIMGDGAALKSTTGTTNAKAYESYLEGRHYLNRRGAGVARAIERFENAIAEDPNFANAHAALASAHAVSNLYLNVPKEIARSRAESYARQALAMDGNLAEPYATLGAMETGRKRWRQALAYFDEAAARDSDNTAVLYRRAEALMSLGYLKAAEDTIERALAVDPGAPVLHMSAGHIANSLGEINKADEYYREVQYLGVQGIVINRGLILFQRGEIEKAADLIANAYVHFQLIPREELGALSAMIERLMRRESTVEKELYAFPTLINDDDARFLFCLFAQQSDEALKTLEADADGDHDTFHYLWSDLDPGLRDAPYFKTFAKNTGLVDYWREFGWPDRCLPRGDNDFECV